ncbi:MAG: carboxypeptidase-like regulatory domain-containing protein [Cytophagales bacterium]|nr:MAG: carboxypeptidase-like regulatory domain-containing protein [Cytophagales bacterium]TAF61534.1 MAG: carboxypeptidase-like regulatory domain-containing protein [Cytophagales bacterium]
MKPFFLILLFCSLLISPLLAQYPYKVFGTITDESGKGMPFVTVLLEGTTRGTTSNESGEYSLPVDKGSFNIVFRLIGYKTELRNIAVGTSHVELNLRMKEEVYGLEGVTVLDKALDPAYQIIKNAQTYRKFYKSQAQKYSYRAYIKGVQKITEKPDKIMGKKIDIFEGMDTKTGIFYLSESLSDYYFEAPNKEKEIIIKSKVSGNSKTITWNSAAAFNTFSIYDNAIEGVAERGIVSPIATNAMIYYKYKYHGEFTDQGVRVNKIEVIPNKRGAPLYKGFIYIQEDTWRIHSCDLTIPKEAGIEFVEYIRIKQTFVPVKKDLWMCGTSVIDFKFDVGFLNIKVKGGGSFSGSFSNFNVRAYNPIAWQNPQKALEQAEKIDENPQKLRKPIAPKRPKLTKETKKTIAVQDSLAIDSKDNFFKQEVKVIDKQSIENDTAFWTQYRPVPLTEEEKLDYIKKDSTEAVRQSRPYRDSVDKRSNKFAILDVVTGYSYRNSYKFYSFSTSPLLEGVQFNTVEGLVMNARIDFSKYIDPEDDVSRKKSTSAFVHGRYGFSSQKSYFKAGFTHRFNAISRSFVSVEGGQFIQQYNRRDPISPLANSIYTILLEQNFMKLYQNTYGQINLGGEVINGLYLNSQVAYAQRSPLENAVPFPKPYINVKDREYSSNDPTVGYAGNDAPLIAQSNALTFSLTARLRFKQTYVSYPNARYTNASPYPTLVLSYTRAVPLQTDDANYDRVGIRLEDALNLGIFGNTDWCFAGGGFLRNKKSYFADYKHFSTTQILFSSSNFESFFALPYYAYSTTAAYIEGHIEHHFNGFLFNALPITRKLKWQPVVGAHLLSTPFANPFSKTVPVDLFWYGEITLGIEHIFKMGRVDYVLSYLPNSKVPSNNFRVSIGF